MRLCVKGHNLAPWGEKYVMLGIAHDHPSSMPRVKNLKTGEIVCWEGVTWHPPDDKHNSSGIGEGGDIAGECQEGQWTIGSRGPNGRW